MSVTGASNSRSHRPCHGSIQVLALSLTETISWGILDYSFSVFLPPMERDLGWSRSEQTGGSSLALIVSGIPMGRWLDRRDAGHHRSASVRFSPAC